MSASESAPVAMVEEIRRSLPPGHEWTERELALLDLAARQAADIERLEADIADIGVRTASGRLNQAFAEARQGRVALGRLLGLVDIPDDVKPVSVHASKAARARWRAAG
jgi:hypothetical protein